MKLIQLNVWWGGKLGYNIRELLEQEKPDIICLQEAISAKRSDSLFYTAEQVAKDLDINNLSFSPLISFSFMHHKVSMGNAILAKHDIVESVTKFTNLEHVENFDFSIHDYNVRNFLHTKIDVNGKQVNVITHHGYHVRDHKNGTAETDKQCQEIADYIKKLDGPIILTGDFNLSPDSNSLKPINNLLKNLPVEHKVKTTRNFLTHKQEVCDFIFINDMVKEKHFEVSEKVVSDHAALVLEFDI